MLRRPSAAMIVATTALVVAAAGGGYAASGVIDGKNLKNGSVREAKLASSSVTSAKIKNRSITGLDVKPNALTGGQINESKLGKVPTATRADSTATADNATNAANAEKLAGKVAGDYLTTGDIIRFATPLAAGEIKTLATHGAVSIQAQCIVNEGGLDKVRILGATTAADSVLEGVTDRSSAATFLTPAIPENQRMILEDQATTGLLSVDNTIDNGWVFDRTGKGLTIDGETTFLTMNYIPGSPCFVAGAITKIG